MTTSAEAARNQLNQARTLVRKGIEDARISIWDLRSQGHEDLPARLTNAVTTAAAHSSTKVYVQVKGTYRPLEQRVEGELLRIGQEAVVNAARHAQATRIDVELAYDDSFLRMSVTDDGRGFAGAQNATSPDGHYGIRGMRERAESIRAQLKLESELGTGTRQRLRPAFQRALLVQVGGDHQRPAGHGGGQACLGAGIAAGQQLGAFRFQAARIKQHRDDAPLFAERQPAGKDGPRSGEGWPGERGSAAALHRARRLPAASHTRISRMAGSARPRSALRYWAGLAANTAPSRA